MGLLPAPAPLPTAKRKTNCRESAHTGVRRKSEETTMPYLIGRAENRFEGRMNTFREGHSPQLTSTIKAVKTYLVEPTPHRIRDVKFCWVAWKVQRPHEFGRKGEEIRTIFEAE